MKKKYIGTPHVIKSPFLSTMLDLKKETFYNSNMTEKLIFKISGLFLVYAWVTEASVFWVGL
jgi:hypothetical protein